MKNTFLKFFILLLVFFPQTAQAHITPGGYLNLQVEGKTIRGAWGFPYSLSLKRRV